jgi:hypothetical protein
VLENIKVEVQKARMGWDFFRDSEGLATERDKIYFRRLGYKRERRQKA